jgi:hypothetical protein
MPAATAENSSRFTLAVSTSRNITSYLEVIMKNPWMKKNPFLSMWLSGANAVAGSARGHATAAAKREINAFWAAALTPPKPKKRKGRR